MLGSDIVKGLSALPLLRSTGILLQLVELVEGLRHR
jgi:hypothetical protein